MTSDLYGFVLFVTLLLLVFINLARTFRRHTRIRPTLVLAFNDFPIKRFL
jgi:hypothetical protein